MPLPDFLIAGVPKAGTTALHAALVPHPALYLSKVKEPKFFLSDGPPPATGGPGDVQTYQEHVWRRADYEALFDPAPPGTVRGEATPFYLYDLAAHDRIKRLVPDAKLIVLLRDPVERAYSHWKERRTEGVEPLGFPEALAAEASRTAGERERLTADPAYVSTAYDWYSYRERGVYLDHLTPWLDRFDRSQLLVMASETLYRDPAASYAKVLDFIGLPPFELPSYDVFNDRPSKGMDDGVRAQLTDFYRPHNAALAQRLGMSFDWA